MKAFNVQGTVTGRLPTNHVPPFQEFPKPAPTSKDYKPAHGGYPGVVLPSRAPKKHSLVLQ